MRRGTDRHRYTQTAVANIYFASTMPHAKCNINGFTYLYWNQTASVKGATTFPSGAWQWIKKGRGQATGCGQCSMFPSVLWHCWLGDRKGIRPIKILCHSSPEVLHQNSWRKKIEGEPADRGSPAKQVLKWGGGGCGGGVCCRRYTQVHLEKGRQTGDLAGDGSTHLIDRDVISETFPKPTSWLDMKKN